MDGILARLQRGTGKYEFSRYSQLQNLPWLEAASKQHAHVNFFTESGSSVDTSSDNIFMPIPCSGSSTRNSRSPVAALRREQDDGQRVAAHARSNPGDRRG